MMFTFLKRRMYLLGRLFLLSALCLGGAPAFAENIYSVGSDDKEGYTMETLIVKDSRSGKKYQGPRDYSVQIVTVRDFDRDGIKDALVTTHGGGTCCPVEYHLVTLKKGRLIIADLEADFSLKYVKEENGRLYLVDQKTDRAEYFSFSGGKLQLTKTVKSLQALKEVRGPGGTYRDELPPEILVFDINDDKTDEEIVCNVWTRWGSLLCELPVPGGGVQELHTGCMRFGVLAGSSHGYHEFVCNFDTVVTFNGSRWVNKAFPGKGDF